MRSSRFSYRPFLLRLWFAVGFILVHLVGAGAQEWTHYGGDAGSRKFVAADQINAKNFADLRVVWRWRPPDEAILKAHKEASTNRYRATPIVVDGVLYAGSPLGIIAAVDAASGQELWHFDPQAWKDQFWYPAMHRGLAYWSDSSQKRLYFGTEDAHLYALDAATGQPVLSFGDSGRVDLTVGLRREINRDHYDLLSPPVVCGDVIVVGSSTPDMRGGPSPKNLPPGDVRGYDSRTGEQLWVFETIPQQGAYGNDTWGGDSWEHFGGVNVWSMMSYDAERDYIYLPVSTPSNDFYGGERPGDNLFGDSIVCLKASTGEYVWHYQLIHHGLWDYDPPSAPILADIEVDGKAIDAVVQLTKHGFVFVFDRETGEPVWPIVEMPVPASAIEGEKASPTQPMPSWPRPFEVQGLSADDLIDFTPQLRQEALDIIKEYEFGSLFTPPSEKGTILMPGLLGGSDWAGGALDVETGMLYVPSHTLPFVVTLSQVEDPQAPSAYGARVRTGLPGPQGLPLMRPPYGRVTAIDLNSGRHVWMQPVGRGPVDHPALKGMDLPDLGWSARTFAVATANLLLTATDDPRTFEGVWAGQDHYVDPEPYLRAWDLQTGEKIGEVPLPGNVTSAPISYEADGRQYVVIPMGDGEIRPTELVALALPRRGDKLPPQGKKRADADHKAFYKAVEALDRGDAKALGKLLKKHKDLVQARGYLDEYYMYPMFRGATLLHHVAGNPMRAPLPENALDLTRLLLERGADANALTLDSLSTIDLAINGAQLEWAEARDVMVALLLQNGADPDRNRGKMLWDALIGNKKEMAALLVENGATLDLRFAAGLGRADLMESFFDDAGLTVQANSMYRPDPDTVLTQQQILDEALNFAAYSGSKEAVTYLIDQGADPNGLAGFWWDWDAGSTSLHKAVNSADIEMIRFLLDKGANPTVADVRWGETAYQWSNYYDDKAVQQILKEAEEAYRREHPPAVQDDGQKDKQADEQAE
jgi:quinoprotein glucose dehydrogenase